MLMIWNVPLEFLQRITRNRKAKDAINIQYPTLHLFSNVWQREKNRFTYDRGILL